MLKLTEDKSNFDGIMTPFRYNDVMVFSKSLAGVEGFYGLQKSGLFFISKEKIDTEFQIEIPENTEELMGIAQSVDFIIQRISIDNNSGVLYFEDDLTIDDKLKPFIEFLVNYEKSIKVIERIKYEYTNRAG